MIAAFEVSNSTYSSSASYSSSSITSSSISSWLKLFCSSDSDPDNCKNINGHYLNDSKYSKDLYDCKSGFCKLTGDDKLDRYSRIEEREKGIDPRVIRKADQPDYKQGSDVITIGYACDKFYEVNTTYGLSKEKVWGRSTAADYKNRIYNQILNPSDGGFKRDTPIKDFEWVNGGRKKLFDMRENIQKRGSLRQADRNFGVCKRIFEYAIDRGWLMEPNPAKSSQETRSKLTVKHNPYLKWEELDKLCLDINENKNNSQPEVVQATKFVLLTAMRVGAVAPLEWKELNEKENVWCIPYEKMKYQRNEDFYVPMTKQMWSIVETMRPITGNTDYVFYSPRSKNKHLNPSSINAFLKRLGYADRLTGHGIRGTVLTANEDVLKFEKNIVRIQMSHKVMDSVERAYNHATYWGKRVEFMETWSDEMEKKGLLV